MTTPYDKSFFEHVDQTSNNSARHVVPLVLDLLEHPVSLVDFGAGIGTWASEFEQHGVRDLICVDGDYVDRNSLRVSQSQFFEGDLTKPIDLGRKFELAVCLEVGEHLPESASDCLVSTLARHADTILFSAAIPHQGGTDHVNEQWPAFWAEKFKTQGFECFDCIRLRIWEISDVSWWYKQNMLVFANAEGIKRGTVASNISQSLVQSPSSLVHTDVYLSAVQALQSHRDLKDIPRLPWAIRAVTKSVQASVKFHMSQLFSK